MPMEAAQALEQLYAFATLVRPVEVYDAGFELAARYTSSNNEAITAHLGGIEQILNEVTPAWRTEVPVAGLDRWGQYRRATAQAITALHQAEESAREALTQSAAGLHPWVWRAAQAKWAVGDYEHAVREALAQVVRQTQLKSGTADLDDLELFSRVFSTKDPQPQAPRLRLSPPQTGQETPQTFLARHIAVKALAQALFAGMCDPADEAVGYERARMQIGLERLATVSVLARWVDAATLHTG